MTARLRHIAISVPDPEEAAVFFEKAFGMTRAGNAGFGIYMTDGTMNVALLRFPEEMFDGKPRWYGIMHFGMWVDNLEEAVKQVTERGHAVAEFAARLGVSVYSMYQWVKRYSVPAEERQASTTY